MKPGRLRTLIAVCAFAATPAMAADPSPAGRWMTIDDESGKPRSVIEIYDAGGAMDGKVTKIYSKPGDNPQHLCRKCAGDLKDKPVIGMTILSGLKNDGDVWDGGTILDPDSGNVYSAKITLIDGGQKLVVRGFLGLSLFGRSQTWVREADASPK